MIMRRGTTLLNSPIPLRDRDWLKRNFGDMSFNSELFDVAMILDAQGHAITAHSDGQDISSRLSDFLTPDVTQLLNRVREMREPVWPEETGFAVTPKGVAAVGVGLIRMKSGERVARAGEERFVVFLRHFTRATVERLSRAYVLPGLALTQEASTERNSVAIRNPAVRAACPAFLGFPFTG